MIKFNGYYTKESDVVYIYLENISPGQVTHTGEVDGFPGLLVDYQGVKPLGIEILNASTIDLKKVLELMTILEKKNR